MKEQCHNHFRKNVLSQKLWQTEEEVIYSILCCLPIGIICHVVVHMMCTASTPHVALIKAQIHFFYWIWDVLHKLVSSIVLGPKNVNYESHLSLKLLWALEKKKRPVGKCRDSGGWNCFRRCSRIRATYSRNTGGQTDDDDDDWKSEFDWKQAVLISVMIFHSHFIWVEIDWW